MINIQKRWVFALIGVILNSSAYAENIKQNTQVHGFISQAYIKTSNNNFWGETSASDNFSFRELGINVSSQPSADLHLAGQILARHAGNLDNGDFHLDYILADYSLASSQTNSLGVRLGRILNPLGLYNETRDIAFTRPGILLPQSIYFDRTRDLAFSSDGIQVHNEFRHDADEFFFQFSAARPIVDGAELELALLGNDMPGKFNPENSYLGRVLWDINGGMSRLALSTAWVKMSYRPGGLDPLGHGEIIFSPTIFSYQYNQEKWSLTSEYAVRRFEYNNFIAISDRHFTGDSWYLQSTYRFLPGWEVFARYDNLFSDKHDRSGNAYELTTGQPGFSRYAKDMTVGLKKTFNNTVMLRAEYHNVDGTAWLPILENTSHLPAHTWDLFSLLISMRF